MLRINSTTKSLLLDFSSLWKKLGSADQMLHGVYPEIAEGFSMTQQSNSERLEGFLHLELLALSGRIIPSCPPSKIAARVRRCDSQRRHPRMF
jgi:hypothetical protein